MCVIHLPLRVALMTTVALAGAAHAEYPDRPIRLIISSAAGGSPDIVMRILAIELVETDGPTNHHRQPARSGADHRHRNGRACGARRLHDRLRERGVARHQQDAAAQSSRTIPTRISCS